MRLTSEQGKPPEETNLVVCNCDDILIMIELYCARGLRLQYHMVYLHLDILLIIANPDPQSVFRVGYVEAAQKPESIENCLDFCIKI